MGRFELTHPYSISVRSVLLVRCFDAALEVGALLSMRAAAVAGALLTLPPMELLEELLLSSPRSSFCFCASSDSSRLSACREKCAWNDQKHLQDTQASQSNYTYNIQQLQHNHI